MSALWSVLVTDQKTYHDFVLQVLKYFQAKMPPFTLDAAKSEYEAFLAAVQSSPNPTFQAIGGFLSQDYVNLDLPHLASGDQMAVNEQLRLHLRFFKQILAQLLARQLTPTAQVEFYRYLRLE